MALWIFLVTAKPLLGQELQLPPRPATALTGYQFAQAIAPLSLQDREARIYSEILSGNVPSFLRKLCPVQVTNVAPSTTNQATFYVTPDYLAIGSDEDYLLMPLSPNLAQRIANALNCSLPTRKMVNDIYAAAAVKLTPSPIPPSPAMTSVATFTNHNGTILSQRLPLLKSQPLGALVAGHKKDVVLSVKLSSSPGKVAIYGWHKTNGVPIQPLYLGHTAAWVDYSQCTRLVHQRVLVDGKEMRLSEVLADPALCGLFSDEGPITNPRYPTNALPAISQTGPTGRTGPTNAATEPISPFHERILSFTLDPEVKVHINAPDNSPAPARKLLFIFYALPNGNTTEQTIGRTLKPGDDWHYDIQHIGAQTRFLREVLHDQVVVVAYLEADQKSWPAWRKKNGDQLIPQLLEQVKTNFIRRCLQQAPPDEIQTAICGHSGGGSLIFGYLNAVQQLPADVTRIAFLDSTYAYDRALGHDKKLVQWLGTNTAPEHYLLVLAYDDANALLNGKPFVTAAGGAWGKSHSVQHDLAESFKFTSQINAEFQKFSALSGRIQFILKENPEHKIFHTVQVERNGFIHAILFGTPIEEKGYEYFGPRAYSKWIEP
ncbi:MAG: hypothetical protein C5B50_30615 [Verrucomicrobia bacterium]|nr:MAG: hypothetical protein C5B50_30615 [Verrucomicrobiota bacterium]